MMTHPEITDARIRAALADRDSERLELTHGSEPGLRLRVGKHATWSLLLRIDGARHRLTLGDWPALSVAQAVEECRKRRQLVMQPVRSEAETIGALLAHYARFKGPRLKRPKGTLQSLGQALETIQFRDPVTVNPQEIAWIVNRKALTAPSHANRQLAYMKAFFNWGIRQGLMSHNPASDVPKPVLEVPRERVLSMDALAAIWRAAEMRAGPYGYIVRLMMLTARRLDEVARIQISELKLPDGREDGEWVIPASRTSNNLAVRIPLSPPARQLIEEALCGSGEHFLFTKNGLRPFSAWSNAKAGLDRWMLADETSLQHWQHRDFQRSFATVATEVLKVRAGVVAACLKHSNSSNHSQVGRVENQSDFRERRSALKDWAELMIEAVGKPAPLPSHPTSASPYERFVSERDKLARPAAPSATPPGSERAARGAAACLRARETCSSWDLKFGAPSAGELAAMEQRVLVLQASVHSVTRNAPTISRPRQSKPAKVLASPGQQDRSEPAAKRTSPEREWGQGSIERETASGWRTAFRLPPNPRYSAEELVRFWCERHEITLRADDDGHTAQISAAQLKDWLVQYVDRGNAAAARLTLEAGSRNRFRIVIG
jgi:integrase